jgi:hypothetical protein
MAEYVTLIGTEAVQSAAITMRQAAEEMRRAANHIDESLRQNQQFLLNWLTDFQTILRDK